MNYWPAEPTNLAECHEPLLRLHRASCAVNGRADRARRTTARAAGSRTTTPTSGRSRRRSAITARAIRSGRSGRWAAAWLSQHLWEHYAFGGDLAFLRDARLSGHEGRGASSASTGWSTTGRGISSPRRPLRRSTSSSCPMAGTAAVSAGATMDLRAHLGSLHQLHRGGDRARRRRRVPRAARAGARAAAPLSDRTARAAAGVGRRTSRSRAASTATSRTCSALYPGPPDHRRRHAGRSSRPRGARWSCAATAATGWSHGLEDQLLGAAARRRPRLPTAEQSAQARCETGDELSQRRRRLSRTSSTPIRRSRSTATSARRPASPRCCCRATPARSICCRRFRRPGRPGVCAGCGRAAA